MTNGAGSQGGMDDLSYVEADRVSATGAIGYAMTKNYATLMLSTTDPKDAPRGPDIRLVALKPFTPRVIDGLMDLKAAAAN